MSEIVTYDQQMKNATDIKIYAIPAEKIHSNPHFTDLNSWMQVYLGAATASLHNLSENPLLAIRDENRNAILPQYSKTIEKRTYYLSIKGCGAYEDMFLGGELTLEKLIAACRDEGLKQKLNSLTSFAGFIMSENWMGESPYGAQGEANGHDELEFSSLASPLSINGAYICPVIALVQIPSKVEQMARNFYWFRRYPKPFYQSLRLVPSRARLYFESHQTAEDPHHLFQIFNLKTAAEIEQFERNFIRSGIALLTLFTRSAKIQNGQVKGLVYIDVWMDKDAIIAPDGVIHFADLEGLDWRTIPVEQYHTLQMAEWHKLVFEFLYALVNIDRFRCSLEELSQNWRYQRQELALQVQYALESDNFVHTRVRDNTLYIIIESSNLPVLEIPFLEGLVS